MVQGSQDRTLTLVPADGDGATKYEAATKVNPANGSFNVVKTFFAGTALNTKVANTAHWVRSRTANGASPWLRCDSYRKTSYVSTKKLADYQDSDANVEVGLDGNGQTPEVPGSYRSFKGQDDDIVVVGVSNRAGLAPNGKKMAWRAKFRLAEQDVNKLKAAGKRELSWNIMQRGLADDPGGQWKMSLVSKESQHVRVQCITQDGRAGDVDMQSVESVIDIGALPIVNGYTPWITATCFSDDSGNARDKNGTRGDSLQIVTNGKASNRKVIPAGVGELINPSSTQTCAAGIRLAANLFPGGIGNVFTIGNKPFCNGTSLDDDRFVGHIQYAEIFKQ